MPVIVDTGLVGSVCEVGYTWCRVRVLTEASSSVGAYIPSSGENGIIEGDISLKDTGICMLTYLSPDADIQVGDLVYTNGQGSVYPRGIFIGVVESVEENEFLRTKSAKVRCAVDFESLKYMIIITDFEIKTE
jgi:rod shape-determining protein MreC